MAAAPDASETLPEPTRLAPFNPTSRVTVGMAVGLLAPTATDTLYEVGCGDGRVLLHAATHVPGLTCVGIEYDPKLAARARDAVAGLPDEAARRITIIEGDATCMDLTAATCIFAYLVPTGLAIMEPKFLEVLRRGGRIVCNMFTLRPCGAKPPTGAAVSADGQRAVWDAAWDDVNVRVTQCRTREGLAVTLYERR